ncbi:MAG: nucleotidyltransferase family protein [Tannerellaceae bacterium]|jgi:D-glycero-alpha-D-manno-heptose 1-phosphate guanylyltransferase|nr:nucleotidyltransferase family protein [Tannerellaceae bacterium]
MEVIVLAGGLGTRLRSVVSRVPKCMAPIAGKPFLYYLLQWLSKFNINQVILSVGYLHEVIGHWIVENRHVFNFKVDLSIENEPLGTGGAIRLALKKTNKNKVFILNGDTFFDIDLKAFNEQHKSNNAMLSVALKPMQNFDRYGNVLINNNLITDFKEKQFCSDGLINGGIYVVNKEYPFFEGLSDKFSFETEVLQSTANKNLIYGCVFDNYFIDIGIPEDYQRANNELVNIIS